jgi:hypothetical protein
MTMRLRTREVDCTVPICTRGQYLHGLIVAGVDALLVGCLAPQTWLPPGMLFCHVFVGALSGAVASPITALHQAVKDSSAIGLRRGTFPPQSRHCPDR